MEKVRPGVRGLFSKDSLNRGSVQNCSQIVVKPWHHRREADGGPVYALSSPVVSKPWLRRRRGGRGPNRNWWPQKSFITQLSSRLAPNAEFTIKMWVRMSPAVNDSHFSCQTLFHRTIAPPTSPPASPLADPRSTCSLQLQYMRQRVNDDVPSTHVSKI